MIIILYPVVKKVPVAVKSLKGRYKVAALSMLARDCAKTSSGRSKLFVEKFEKDGSGVPLSSKGVFWSVTHKPGFVGGVVSQERIGIDLERIKNISKALFNRIIDPDERSLFRGQDKDICFFRAFTAKEAVLKKTSQGIKGLSKVKIKTVVDDKNLIVRYSDKKYLVENFYFAGYLASVTKDHFNVQWTLE
ncbi:MAG: 4'-phosphopantetheinyl transferase superfamily protein [Deltaproteobacteria bacterium]|nr:4'-phosphopantetheinyl transferase superfamily protein [Deltaproteobacteria bacterium]